VLYLKGIVSFTVDTKIYEQFQTIVPSYAKSQTIEFLLREFLNKKSPERVSILSQACSKKTNSQKKEVNSS